MKILVFFVSHFRPFWLWVNKTPWLAKFVNRIIINTLVTSTNPRPLPFSMFSHENIPGNEDDYNNPMKWHTCTYTSWQSLTNIKFSNRHLGSADDAFMNALPDIEETTKLFLRKGSKPVLSEDSTVLFMGFAQWFTDAFLRIHSKDIRQNTSNHGIDLCQIYGLDEETTKILRKKEHGKLKTQLINNKEFLPYLFKPSDGNDEPKVKDEFKGLGYIDILPSLYQDSWTDLKRRRKFYATGLERGNSTITHAAFNTLFVRAHNKICDKLSAKHDDWDDERLFQVTRNILTVVLVNIVVEDYINHISATHFRFIADPSFAESQRWYRTNWMSTEFNLLYRWHSLIPDSITIGEEIFTTKDRFALNNEYVEKFDLGSIFQDISRQQAGKIVIGNVPDFMFHAEKRALFISRCSRLKSYNDYRVCYGLSRLTKMTELTTKKEHLEMLNKLYRNDINNVELTVGLFAEETDDVLGELIIRMVASEAFSHALTNPLLSKYVFNEKTFTATGLELIKSISSIRELVKFTEGESFGITFDYRKEKETNNQKL